MPLADVAIGALLAQPAVASVIAGATRPEQVATNAAAANWNPSAEELEALAGYCSRRRQVGAGQAARATTSRQPAKLEREAPARRREDRRSAGRR